MVYTIRVTISCIYYFVFTISFYFMHFINLSGYLAASVQIKPVDHLIARPLHDNHGLAYSGIDASMLLHRSENCIM